MTTLTFRTEDGATVATVEVPEISLRTNSLMLDLYAADQKRPFASLRAASLGTSLVVSLAGLDPTRRDLPGQASTRLARR